MKRFVYLFVFLLLTAMGLSQQKEHKVLSAEPTQISIGAGSMLGEESMTFSWVGFFGAVHWHGIRIMDDTATSGVGLEIHPSAVFSYSDSDASIQKFEAVDWRVWSLNRLKMSTFQIPGEIWEKIYIGSDLLIAEGGSTDFTGDFTARFVFGSREKAGPGWLDFEIYMFEKYRPISFAFLYRYNF